MSVSVNEAAAPWLANAILSKRIAHSSIYQSVWKFTTQERKRKFLVFVGEVSILLKEILDSNQLRHVVVKDDFESKIRSSSVLPTWTSDEDRSSSDKMKSLEAFSQTLVLCLDDGRFCVLTASDCGPDVKFVTYTVPLPTRPTLLNDPGKFIAADPHARALAFAAIKDTVVLYNLKQRSALPSSWENVDTDAFVVNVNMTVHAVDFLHPPKGDNDSINLVIVGTRDGRLSVVVYCWNHSAHRLQKNTIRNHYHPLGQEHGTPTILALLKHAGSFLLVCERTLAIYQYGYDGSVQPTWCSPISPASEWPPTSPRPPLWTAWSRSLGQSDSNVDKLYVVREDGLLSHLSFSKTRGVVSIVGSGTIGNLGTNIDTAFTVVDAFTAEKETVAACGVNSDGGLFEIDILNLTEVNDAPLSSSSNMVTNVKRIDKIPNSMSGPRLAVATPLKAAQNPARSQSSHGQKYIADKIKFPPPDQDKLLAMAAHHPEGALLELRRGLKMYLTHISTFPSVEGLESLQCVHVCAQYILVACSFAWQTTLIYADADPSSDWKASCEISKEPTLAISALPPDSFDSLIPVTCPHVIQVTPSMVQIVEVDNNNPQSPSMQRLTRFKFEKITTATICPRRKYLFLGLKSDLEYKLCVKELVFSDGCYSLLDVGEPFDVDIEPTSAVEIDIPQHLDDRMIVDSVSAALENQDIHLAVGFATGDIRIMRFSYERNWGVSWHSDTSTHDLFNACEQLVMLSPSTTPILLGCFRDGTVHVLELRIEDTTGSPEVIDDTTIRFGILPARAVAQSGGQKAVFICCNSRMYYVDFNGRLMGKPKPTQVLFEHARVEAESTGTEADRTNVDYFHPDEVFIAAACVLPGNTPYGSLLYVSDGKAYLGSIMSNQPDLLPRYLPFPVHGIRESVMYSSHLQALVVTATATHVNRKTGDRWQTSSLNVLDWNNSLNNHNIYPIDNQTRPLVAGSLEFLKNEKITDVTDWVYTRGETSWHFLIASTIRQDSANKLTGSLRFVRVGDRTRGTWTMKFEKNVEENRPIYALSQFGRDSIVYGSGSHLMIRRFTDEKQLVMLNIPSVKHDQNRDTDTTNSFNRLAAIGLPSPAIFITTNGSLVYVTLASHGFAVYDYIADGKYFNLLFTGKEASPSICHVPLTPAHSFLVSDRHGHVSNMYLFPDPSDFELQPSLQQGAWLKATLPCSMISLVKAHTRPPWQQQAPGVHEDCIFGAAAEGSLFCFRMLTLPAQKLLCLVQKMCQMDTRVSPMHVPTAEEQVAEYMNNTEDKSNHYHIDGDVLARLVGLPDALDVLKDMLFKGMEPRLCRQRIRTCQAQLDVLMPRALTPGASGQMDTEEDDGDVDVDGIAVGILKFLDAVLAIPL